MASIKFYATTHNAGSPGGILIEHENGSGLGFYGDGYGVSVPINTSQKTTWLTNSDGSSSERIRLQNTAVAGNQVSIDGGAAINLNVLPNLSCPLNIRFDHSEEVAVQNCVLRIFDRADISNHASGVTTYVYESRHPSTDEAEANLALADGPDNAWTIFDPAIPSSMEDMTFTSSPGISGTNTTGGDDTGLGAVTYEDRGHKSTRHDWYAALSAEPDSIGSKLNYALYFSVEYL